MIKYINRFENWNGPASGDLYIVFYTSGRTRSVAGFAALPKTARQFIANAKNFEFRKGISGEYYHRFS